MALGTPVIASDIPIFREVGGDTASYVDPDSATDFAAAVKKLRDDEHWQEVSRRSVARAAEFSWDESARQLVDVAHDIVAARSRRKRPL
jgi:glycosyltransferase involved in cell wall biosynthesis